MNGSISASPLTVNAGGLLGGTGSLAATSIASDATLSPGDGGPGVLTCTNGLNLAAESVTRLDLGSTRDRIDVTGNLALNGIINFTNLGGLVPGTYIIFNYSGSLSGSGLSIGSVPADFACSIDTATTGQVKLVVTSTLSPFQQWQVLWFGDYNSPNAAASADPDLDGQTNNDEFLAGTDPTSAASVATLVWRGDGSANLWNAGLAANFWNGNRLSTFTQGNPVLFDATGSANPTVNLTGSLAPVSVTVNNSAAFTFAGPGGLSGNTGLSKTGSGTLNFNAPSSHSGLNSLSGGTLQWSGNQSAATGGFALSIPNSATSTLNIGSTTQTATTSASIAAGKSVQLGAVPLVDVATGNSAQTLNINGASAANTTVQNQGPLIVARNSTLTLGDHSTWNQSGPINVQANGGFGATLNIGSVNGSNAAMNYSAAVPIQLSQVATTSSISTLLIRGGTLTTGQPVQFNGASGNANGYGRLILAGGGRIKLSSHIPQLITGDSSGRLILSNGGGGVIDTNGFNTSIDRAFADSNSSTFIGSLTKAGLGILTLSATHSYTGTTTVTGGTLLVQGSIATSSTSVESGATIGGSGTSGALTILTGGNLAPGGETTGTLNTGALTLQNGSNSQFQLGSSSDRVNVSGALTLGGSIVISDSGGLRSGTYILFTHSGARSGSATITPPPGYAASLDTATPGQVKVQLSANTYATWALDQFTPTELANPAISGPNASPANDGLTNLIKYALGLPPKVPSITGITLTKPAGTWLFTYTRPANRADISYSVEISPNLQSSTWTSFGVTHQLLTPGDPQTWQATAPAGSTQFLRLKITQP